MAANLTKCVQLGYWSQDRRRPTSRPTVFNAIIVMADYRRPRSTTSHAITN